MTNVPAMAQRSIKWCQSRLFLDKREASNANTAPTLPEHTAANRRPKPGRSTEPVPERPKCAHLLHRRLPDIDVGLTLNVTRLDLLAHRSPPRRWLGLCPQLSAASDLVTRGNAVAWSAATPVCGESPRAELPGVVGSSVAPPGEDASEATVLVGAGVHCCASTSSRSAKRAVIDRVGRSTISIPWQRSSSSIHSGIRICIP